MRSGDLELFLGGDAIFMQTLYARQRSKLRHCARHYLHDPDEADDAVAETWEVAWEQREQYRGDGPIEHWLQKICISICVDRLRSRKREAKLLQWSSDLEHADVGERVAEAAELMLQRATADISSAVDALPPRQRQAVELRMWSKKSTAETAESMQCAEGTVKSNLHKAIKQLAPKTRSAVNTLSAAREALDSGSPDSCL